MDFISSRSPCISWNQGNSGYSAPWLSFGPLCLGQQDMKYGSRAGHQGKQVCTELRKSPPPPQERAKHKDRRGLLWMWVFLSCQLSWYLTHVVLSALHPRQPWVSQDPGRHKEEPQDKTFQTMLHGTESQKEHCEEKRCWGNTTSHIPSRMGHTG